MKIWNSRRMIWVVGSVGLFFRASLGYSGEYIITDLGIGGGVGIPNSSFNVYDVNIHGEVVGGVSSAYVWKGAMIDIAVPDIVYSVASANNDLGYVAANHTSPFVWHQDTGVIPLAIESGTNAFARDINNARQVVGNYLDSSGQSQAYMWQPDGLGVPLDITMGEFSYAVAINDADPVQVVGTQAVGGRAHAFLWSENKLRDLGEYQGQDTVAADVNNHGVVVGWYGTVGYTAWNSLPLPYTEYSADRHAFLWSGDEEGESWVDLGTLASDNAGQSVAYAINNSGQVVGFADTDNGESRAFIYSPQTGMQDLNDMLSNGSGWVLHAAHGINDLGQVVGWGSINGLVWPFLLTPLDASPITNIDIQHSYVSEHPRVGEPVTLRVTINNKGTESSTVEIQHTLAPELELTTKPDGCVVNGQQMECEAVALSSGESMLMTFDVVPLEWGRWAVASYATAETPVGNTYLAEEVAYIPAARHEPEVAPTYHIEDLGEYVTMADDRGPRVNNVEEVALGTSYVYSDRELQYSDNGVAQINDVNDNGWFVGVAASDAVMWNPGEELEYLGQLSGVESFDVFGINNHGVVVGTGIEVTGASKAFLASVDTPPLEIGHFGGGESEAGDINDDGWIAGSSRLTTGETRAFLYRDTEGLEELDTLGGRDSWAYALNNTGTIVGEAETSEEALRAFRWSLAEGMVDLGTLSQGGHSRALDINEAGAAVGEALDVNGDPKAVQFIEGRVEDLNDRLSPVSPWQFQKASGINDWGHIAGIGLWDNDPNPHGFLMTELTTAPLFAEEHSLPPHETALGPGAGYAMALDGDSLAIGYPFSGQDKVGEVAIYRRVDGQWEFEYLIKAFDGEPGDQFGRALALDGSRLAIGAYGAIYIYENQEGLWLQAGTRLNTPNAYREPENELYFGAVLALENETLVTTYQESAASHAFAVYTFDGTDWIQADLLGSGLAFFNLGMRQKIVLQGGYLLLDNYIYKHEGDAWVASAYIGSISGHIDGDTLVVGRPTLGFEDSEGWVGHVGQVDVYELKDGQWLNEAVLYSSGREDRRSIAGSSSEPPNHGEQFGYSVAIKGDVIAVGAPNGNEGEAGAGAVYIFKRDGSQWLEETKLTTSDPEVGQQLGWVVGLGEDFVITSAPGRADGTVYSYTLSHSPDSADLHLAMSAGRSNVGVGEVVTFTLTVDNQSETIAATGVVITAVLPVELQLNDTTETCTSEASIIICKLDIVPEAESRQFTISAKATEESTVSSQAWVSAYQDDPNPDDNQASVDIQIEPAPPPRIVNLSPVDGATVTLSPHDTLNLSFNVEHFALEPPSGRHVHWWLNGESQQDLYDEFINLTDLEQADYTIALVLAEADHAEIGELFSTSFSIARPPWPSVDINRPVDGAELVLPIQLSYQLDYAGIAIGPQDFELTLDENELTPLENISSVFFEDLVVGEHTVEIRYNESAAADAVVTFIVLADNAPSADEEQEQGVSTPGQAPARKSGGSGGGGGLSWLIVIMVVLFSKKIAVV